MKYFFLFFLPTLSFSFDVKWTPSDPNGPLPLSKNYRQNLKKLCQLLDHDQRLPNEIENEKETILKLCQKLKNSNDMEESSSYSSSFFSSFFSTPPTSSSTTGTSSISIIIGVGVILCLIFIANKNTIRKFLQTSSVTGTSTKDPALTREARLKKFDRID